MTHTRLVAARLLHLVRQRWPAWVLALLATLAPTPAEAETLGRADNSEITYQLHKAPAATRSGVLLMLQGSGCEPVAARPWLRAEPPLIAPGYAVLSVEKFGVWPGQPKTGLVDGCSPDYWARNTLQQRVLDALQVIAKLRSEPWWNRKLIIYGGSEGGAVAALLAPLLAETKAVVIVSSGIGVSVAELIRAAVPPPVALQMPAIMAEAKANPTGDKRFGGASYRWWADAAEIVPAKALLQTNAPVLLIQGRRDQFAPVATARATRDLFRAAGKRNLIYREYSAYDHFMKDAAGVDHTPTVLRYVREWLERSDSMPTVVANDSLRGRWTITAVNGRKTVSLWLDLGGEGLGPINRTGNGILVGSPQPRTQAFLGCNDWHPNGWARTGDKLTLGTEMSRRTERGCDAEAMALDDRAYAVLSKPMTMEFASPNRLRLVNENGFLDLVRDAT